MDTPDSLNQSHFSQVRVGVGVLIIKDGKILLGKRKAAIGAGKYELPGGHLEFNESFIECGRRETMEETGLEIKDIEFNCVANMYGIYDAHYVGIGLKAKWKSGEAKNIEPNKNEGWKWYGFDELPEPIFESSKINIDSYLNHKIYWELSG
jgi:8-oxo-dGTP diphosphatase